jgi:hypothetical protein
MAKTTTQTETEERITPAAMIEAIVRKIAGLEERNRALLGRQLELEHDGVMPIEHVERADAQSLAVELLNGHAVPTDSEPTPGEVLHGIIKERAAIKIAIESLQNKETQARILALGEIMQEASSDWRMIVRRRAVALLELRAANVEATEFRERLRKLSKMTPTLICDRQAGSLFGPPIVGDESYRFFEDCIAAGIVAASEVKK